MSFPKLENFLVFTTKNKNDQSNSVVSIIFVLSLLYWGLVTQANLYVSSLYFSLLLRLLSVVQAWLEKNVGSWCCTKMGDRSTKSIKPETNFIPEKGKKITVGHTKIISYNCDHSQRSNLCSCGNGGWVWASFYSKINSRCGSKSFCNLEVRLKP